MDSKNVVITVVVLLILGFLGWMLLGNDTSVPATQTENEAVAPPPTTTGAVPPPVAPVAIGSATTPQSVVVTYTDAGFSPATITVGVGTTVTFVNNSSNARGMWVGSDEHPTHANYGGTTKNDHCAAGYAGPAPFDACRAISNGASWSFTFTKKGTWDYHDHTNAAMGGKVVVN